MTSNPVCVNADDLLAKARSLIRKHGYRALPVLDNNRLVGIISRSDILRVTSTKTNLQVKGLMTPNVVTVSDSEDVTNVARLMVKNAVRQTPVLDKSGKLVGVISALDVLNAFVERKISPVKKSVRDVMSVDVVSCSPEENITKVWEKMLSTGFSGLPVVEKSKVVGIITRMDLLKHGSARPHRESGKNKHVPVRKVMQKKVITASIGEDTAIVAHLMTANRIIRLPVVEKGMKLAGIVDIEDLLQAYV